MDGTPPAGPTEPGLPLGYRSLTPLFSEQHAGLRFRRVRDFSFARELHAVPLAVAEIGRAQADFPVVFMADPPWLPIGLLAARPGPNDFVDDDGGWRADAYAPAYLRRYPFALVRESQSSDRMLVCADLQAPHFDAGEDDELIFVDGVPGPAMQETTAFCTRYEQALATTRDVTGRLHDLGLFDDANVKLESAPAADGRSNSLELEGLKLISEERLRALDDGVLAALARDGLVGLIAGHHYSLDRFVGANLEKT